MDYHTSERDFRHGLRQRDGIKKSYHSPLENVFSYTDNTTTTTTTLEPDKGPPDFGLYFVLILASVVAVIAVIILVVSKIRRQQSTDSTDENTQENIEMPELQEDPYLRAIMFPSEPEPEWHQSVRTVLRSASQKILRKPQEPPHRTSIPEDLRYQLKHIYVY